MIASLLVRAGLTLADAGELCDVTARTVANWRDGKTPVPAKALAAMEAAAAAREPEPEAMSLAERIATLRAIQAIQSREVGNLENELAEMRRELGRTTSQLNALYAERGKIEIESP